MNYGSVAQKNDKVYGIQDLNTLNKKMDHLLKHNLTKRKKNDSLSGKVHPKIQTVLEEHELLEAFTISDFKGIDFFDDDEDNLKIDDEIMVHERVSP